MAAELPAAVRRTHSSVHTTISALEGLRHYGAAPPAQTRRRARGPAPRPRVSSWSTLFARTAPAQSSTDLPPLLLPAALALDILRALDYFQAVNAPRDPRLAEAIGHRPQRAGRRRPLDASQNSSGARPTSSWNNWAHPAAGTTLRALRVLKWWDGGRRGGQS